MPCWRFGDNSEHGIQLVSAKLEFNRNTSTTKNSNVAEVWQDSEVYVIATIVRDLFTALRKRESETSETEIRFFNVLKEHVFRQCQVKVRAYSPRSCWPRARTIFPRSRRTSRLFSRGQLLSRLRLSSCSLSVYGGYSLASALPTWRHEIPIFT